MHAIIMDAMDAACTNVSALRVQNPQKISPLEFFHYTVSVPCMLAPIPTPPLQNPHTKFIPREKFAIWTTSYLSWNENMRTSNYLMVLQWMHNYKIICDRIL